MEAEIEHKIPPTLALSNRCIGNGIPTGMAESGFPAILKISKGRECLGPLDELKANICGDDAMTIAKHMLRREIYRKTTTSAVRRTQYESLSQRIFKKKKNFIKLKKVTINHFIFMHEIVEERRGMRGDRTEFTIL